MLVDKKGKPLANSSDFLTYKKWLLIQCYGKILVVLP